MVNSEGPDQMPRSAASNQGPSCLALSDIIPRVNMVRHLMLQKKILIKFVNDCESGLFNACPYPYAGI